MSDMVFGNNHDPSFQRDMRKAYEQGKEVGIHIAADELRKEIDKAVAAEQRCERLAGLLQQTKHYIQHIDAVENSSCFYSCTCGAIDLITDVDAALLGDAAEGVTQ